MKNLSYGEYLNKVYGCFLGKTVVGTLGAPFEGIKMPMELPFERSMIDAMLPNDDLDLQLIWLLAVKENGPNINERLLGEYWQEYISPFWNEYGIGKANMARGLIPPLSGKILFENGLKRNEIGYLPQQAGCMAGFFCTCYKIIKIISILFSCHCLSS